MVKLVNNTVEVDNSRTYIGPNQ